MPKPKDSALAKNTNDWLAELHDLRDRALSRHDAVQAEELQAEIAELTAYLDKAFEDAA
jgi:hypothetical protein